MRRAPRSTQCSQSMRKHSATNHGALNNGEIATLLAAILAMSSAWLSLCERIRLCNVNEHPKTNKRTCKIHYMVAIADSHT